MSENVGVVQHGRSTCPKCGGNRKQKRDKYDRGRGWRCRSCENELRRSKRAKDKEWIRDNLPPFKKQEKNYVICPKCGRDRKQKTDHGHKDGWRCFYCYRVNNKEKASAHDKVEWAIHTGKLIRKPCEICGKEKTDAHHEDYSKPLDVRWLCKKHHAQLHAGTMG